MVWMSVEFDLGNPTLREYGGDGRWNRHVWSVSVIEASKGSSWYDSVLDASYHMFMVNHGLARKFKETNHEVKTFH